MRLDEYQTRAMETAVYTTIGHPCVYPALGLAEESGETVGKVKRLFRDHAGEVTDAWRADMLLELGDVLWYLACTATELGFSLEQVASANLSKTKDRKQRGVIRGEGDNR